MKKTKSFKKNRPENYHVHDNDQTLDAHDWRFMLVFLVVYKTRRSYYRRHSLFPRNHDVVLSFLLSECCCSYAASRQIPLPITARKAKQSLTSSLISLLHRPPDSHSSICMSLFLVVLGVRRSDYFGILTMGCFCRRMNLSLPTRTRGSSGWTWQLRNGGTGCR